MLIMRWTVNVFGHNLADGKLYEKIAVVTLIRAHFLPAANVMK